MARWSFDRKSMKKQVYQNTEAPDAGYNSWYNYGLLHFSEVSNEDTRPYTKIRVKTGVYLCSLKERGLTFLWVLFVFLWASGQTESDRATRSERGKKQKKQICLRRFFDLTKWQKSCWKAKCQSNKQDANWITYRNSTRWSTKKVVYRKFDFFSNKLLLLSKRILIWSTHCTSKY